MSTILESTQHWKMTYSELSPWERHERARRIDFAIRNCYEMIDLEPFTAEELNSPEVEEKVFKGLSAPATITKFLHAALLIRQNKAQWTRFLNNPSKKAPKVFEMFAYDKLFVFYLYLCDAMKIFHLDPRFPFLVCEQKDTRTFVINGQADDHLETIKRIIKEWYLIGSPWKESEWGVELVKISEKLKEISFASKQKGNISIGWHFWVLTRRFGFKLSLSDIGQSSSTDKGYLDMFSFEEDLSVAIAFDKEINTLELLYELFPQFPELPSNVVKKYYLSITNSGNCALEDEFTACEHEIISNENQDQTQTARHFLTKMFETKIWYDGMDENIPLRNQSILDTVQNHPEIFSHWATDSSMLKLYRELIDSETLYS